MNSAKSEEETFYILSMPCDCRKFVSSCFSISVGRETSLRGTAGRYPREERWVKLGS